MIKTNNINNRRRGSAILMVLAVLAIMILLGVIFTFVIRAETQATHNYAELAQARAAAVSGLPDVVALVAATGPVTTTLQPWYAAPQALRKVVTGANGSVSLNAQELSSLRSANFATGQTPEGDVLGAPMALTEIKDLSGRVNLNTVPNETVLAAFIESVLPGSDAERKARAVFIMRDMYSSNKSSSEREGTFSAYDPRKGDHGISSLSALRASTDSKQSGRIFSEEDLKKLAGFVTVFSQAPESFITKNEEIIGRLPADQIQADQVFRVLKAMYDTAPDALLLQYALNLQDFVDTDQIPATAVVGQANALAQPAATLIGMEKGLPSISEVYPDSHTGPTFSDDGQFAEIYNPWPESINLNGMYLTVAGGSRISLSGELVSQGSLVITDNYNTPIPDVPVGAGGIMAIFGATENGGNKRVLINAAMDLPDADSYITLHDSLGNLLDVFAYGRLTEMDSKFSFQRLNPFLKTSEIATATPFDRPPNAGGVDSPDMNLAYQAWSRGNRGILENVSDVLLISTSFTSPSATVATVPPANSIQYPNLTLPEDGSGEEAPPVTNLDLRLLDIFTDLTSDTVQTAELGMQADMASPQQKAATSETVEQSYRLMKRSLIPVAGATQAETSATPTLYSYGKLNVNTCSPAALSTINGKAGAGWKMSEMAPRFEAHRMDKLSAQEAPFASVSELVHYFAPALQRSQLAVVDELLSQATVGSSAFEITSENRVPSPPPTAAGKANGAVKESRHASVARASWLISTDTAPYEILNFTVAP